MATKPVTVTVHCKQNGKLSIEVDNWEVKGRKSNNDDVQWSCFAKPGDGAVKWIRIDNPGNAIDWPFAAKPPDQRYIARPNQPATSGPLDPAYVPSSNPIRYGITVCFTDDNDPTTDRYAYIDPDMVFEA